LITLHQQRDIVIGWSNATWRWSSCQDCTSQHACPNTRTGPNNHQKVCHLTISSDLDASPTDSRKSMRLGSPLYKRSAGVCSCQLCATLAYWWPSQVDAALSDQNDSLHVFDSKNTQSDDCLSTSSSALLRASALSITLKSHDADLADTRNSRKLR
jgi:hypothetical protein